MAKSPEFSPEEVRRIRQLWDEGQTARSLARLYGRAAETMARIGRRETYAHVGEIEAPRAGAEESLRRLLEELGPEGEGK